MLKKGDIKSVGLVTIGVLLAGLIMHKFSDVAGVDQAYAGFNYKGTQSWPA